MVILEGPTADVSSEGLTIEIECRIFVDRSVLAKRFGRIVDFRDLDRQRCIDWNATWLGVGHLIDDQDRSTVDECWSGVDDAVIGWIIRSVGAYNGRSAFTRLWLLNDREQPADKAIVDKIVGSHVDRVACVFRLFSG